MTGFGRAEQTVGDKTFLIDIKSLNGKQFELLLKLPGFLKPYEFDIRSILSQKLGRGSVDCTISLKQTGSAKPVISFLPPQVRCTAAIRVCRSLPMTMSTIRSVCTRQPRKPMN